MRKHVTSGSWSKFRTSRRAAAVSLVALVVASGCVTQEPPTNEYVNDLQSDFDTEHYFDP